VSAPPEGRRQKTLIQNREGGGQRTARIEFELPPAQNSKLITLKTHSTEKFTFARSLVFLKKAKTRENFEIRYGRNFMSRTVLNINSWKSI
jgi:hypothetical protein